MSPAPVADIPSEQEPDRQSIVITDVPVTYPHEMGLLKEAKDQYSRDSFYRRVMDTPKPFKNFEVANGFIHLNLHNRTVCQWCARYSSRRKATAGIYH